MKLEQFFLFSDQLRKLFRYLARVLVIVGRFALILIKGFRRLSVHSLRLNDSLLLSNGLIAINWQLKNFLYVRINGRITSVSSKGIVFYYSYISAPLIVYVVGVFGSYTARFNLQPVAFVNTSVLRPPVIDNSKFQSALMNPAIISFTAVNTETGFMNAALTNNLQVCIQPLAILIPTFKTENKYD